MDERLRFIARLLEGEKVDAFKGDQLPIVPEFKANLVRRYEFPVGDMNGHFQAAVVYNGDTYSDLKREDKAVTGVNPSYTITDLSLGVQTSSYAIELYVNNAFDELNRNYTFAQCLTSTCGSQPYYVPSQPRTIGLKFSHEF